MSTSKTNMKNSVPQNILLKGKELYDGIKRLGDIPEAYFDPVRRDYMEGLSRLKGSRQGER